MTIESTSTSNTITPFEAPNHTSTTSSATTLVDHTPIFNSPSRSGTGSTTASTATTTTTSPPHHETRSSTPPTSRRSVENKSNKNVDISPVQKELLRYKGTYTDSGRHSDDWLFGGWSFTGTVKGAWKKVAGGGNGEGENRG